MKEENPKTKKEKYRIVKKERKKESISINADQVLSIAMFLVPEQLGIFGTHYRGNYVKIDNELYSSTKIIRTLIERQRHIELNYFKCSNIQDKLLELELETGADDTPKIVFRYNEPIQFKWGYKMLITEGKKKQIEKLRERDEKRSAKREIKSGTKWEKLRDE